MATTTPKAATAAKSKNAELDELNALACMVKEQEEVTRAEIGGQNTYIKLIGDPQAPELKEGKPEYIKGAKYESFVIPNKKINLGKKFEATIVGMYKLYEESEAKKDGGKDELSKIFGYWMPEDAENIPVDGMFDRPFVAKDGTQHVLRPVHWLVLRLSKFPELQKVTISFRSTGNSVYAKLAKLVKNSSEIASQLKIEVTSQAIENKTWNKTNLYPDFNITGKNFDFVDGKIKLIDEEEGGMSVEEIKEVLAISADLNKEYQENKMVARKANIAALIGAPAGGTKAIGAPGGARSAASYKDDDDEEETTKF